MSRGRREPDSPPPRPPRLGERLLGWALGDPEHHVIGDLREEYADRRRTGFRLAVDAWHMWVSLALTARLGVRRRATMWGAVNYLRTTARA